MFCTKLSTWISNSKNQAKTPSPVAPSTAIPTFGASLRPSPVHPVSQSRLWSTQNELGNEESRPPASGVRGRREVLRPPAHGLQSPASGLRPLQGNRPLPKSIARLDLAAPDQSGNMFWQDVAGRGNQCPMTSSLKLLANEQLGGEWRCCRRFW